MSPQDRILEILQESLSVAGEGILLEVLDRDERRRDRQRVGQVLKPRRPSLRIVAVEPASCPTLTKGRYVYDFGDTAGTTPMMKMYTLGHTFVPSGIHAGGLRASFPRPRRGRLAKTDRLDVHKLLTMLLRYVAGEKRVWSIVRVPSIEEEDRRQLHRALATAKRRNRLSRR